MTRRLSAWGLPALVLATGLARHGDARVVMVEYRLSPEHPYPQPQRDMRQVYPALLESYGAERLVVSGESAGGNQAVGLLQQIRSSGLPLPRCAALLSPWVDLGNQGQYDIAVMGTAGQYNDPDALANFVDGRRGASFVRSHGFSDDGLCWTPVAELLAVDYNVLMVDARGHGRSDGPEQGYGSAEHAADLAGLIEALQLKRPIVLGHSMGAATALALAGLYPNLPSAILLEDPPPWWMPPDPAADSGPPRDMSLWIIDLKRKTREEMIAQQRQ